MFLFGIHVRFGGARARVSVCSCNLAVESWYLVLEACEGGGGGCGVCFLVLSCQEGVEWAFACVRELVCARWALR